MTCIPRAGALNTRAGPRSAPFDCTGARWTKRPLRSRGDEGFLVPVVHAPSARCPHVARHVQAPPPSRLMHKEPCEIADVSDQIREMILQGFGAVETDALQSGSTLTAPLTITPLSTLTNSAV